MVYWGGGIKAGERNKLDKTIKKASSVVLPYGRTAISGRQEEKRKLTSIMVNPSHPLYADLKARKSTFSQRLTLPPNVHMEHL